MRLYLLFRRQALWRVGRLFDAPGEGQEPPPLVGFRLKEAHLLAAVAPGYG
jgi:hypothetical protein